MIISLGSGPEKSSHEDCVCVDNNPAHHPDICMDIAEYVRTLPTAAVDKFRCANILSMLTGIQIFKLFNDMHRVLKFNGRLYIEQMLVHYAGGEFNAKAWTTPLDQTHWSVHMLRCFEGGVTQKYRGVKPWKILEEEITLYGVLKANLRPIEEDGHEDETFEHWLRSATKR